MGFSFIFKFFEEPAYSIMAAPIYICISSVQGFVFSTSSSTLYLLSFLMTAILTNMSWYFIVFLMISSIENCFLYPLTICRSSSENSVLSFIVLLRLPKWILGASPRAVFAHGQLSNHWFSWEKEKWGCWALQSSPFPCYSFLSSLCCV